MELEPSFAFLEHSQRQCLRADALGPVGAEEFGGEFPVEARGGGEKTEPDSAFRLERSVDLVGEELVELLGELEAVGRQRVSVVVRLARPITAGQPPARARRPELIPSWTPASISSTSSSLIARRLCPTSSTSP